MKPYEEFKKTLDPIKYGNVVYLIVIIILDWFNLFQDIMYVLVLTGLKIFAILLLFENINLRYNYFSCQDKYRALKKLDGGEPS